MLKEAQVDLIRIIPELTAKTRQIFFWIANCPSDVDVRQPPGSLPVSEAISEYVFAVPWFKHYRPKIIAEYADAFRKVTENHKELHAGDTGYPNNYGQLGIKCLQKIIEQKTVFTRMGCGLSEIGNCWCC